MADPHHYRVDTNGLQPQKGRLPQLQHIPNQTWMFCFTGLKAGRGEATDQGHEKGHDKGQPHLWDRHQFLNCGLPYPFYSPGNQVVSLL